MNKKQQALTLLVVLCSSAWVTACVSPPARMNVEQTLSRRPAAAGRLAQVADAIDGDLAPGESAFWLLSNAEFSFEARLALVDRAVDSLDIQYFIWEKDPTSRLFSHRVIQAADRGVRVRLLLDDLTLNSQDAEFVGLADHPNIEVRSFNPWNARRNIGRVLELMFRFGQVNHRMHLKTVVADGYFSIIGGRNIGDRYFGVWEEFVQNDLDIMSTGPIVAEVASSFDLYWNSELSYPLTGLANKRDAAQQLAPAAAMIEAAYLEEADKLQAYPLQPASWDDFLERIRNSHVTGTATLGLDLPNVHEALPDQLNAPLRAMIARAERRVLICTAYLIPSPEFFDLLTELETRGVEVVLLTNSLASNNHMIAHAAYKAWRKDLLEIGVDLYEARADSAYLRAYAVPSVEPEFLGLHSKAIVVDDYLSFVGTPNIDPRSLIINTESGLFVESETLAAELTALIERDISAEAAWRVHFDETGRLRWVSSAGTLKKQPARGLLQRITAFFINWLPLKGQA